MTVTAPPTIDALPAAPDPNDRATFNARAYPWAAAQAVLATQVSAVAENVHDNASAAESAASSASSSESAASASAASASSDAHRAASDADSAEAAWADFDKRYLGSKSVPPTTDNSGNALVVGALYFNTALGTMRTWNGADWDASFLPESGYQEKLVAGGNLKRINGVSLLGAGDMVVSHPVQEFTSSGIWTKATGAQFVLAELWSAGGGGASGSRGAAGLRRDGGSGGGGGARKWRLFKASDLPDSVPVAIGLGGEGGAAVTVGNTLGKFGSRGGNTSFGDFLTVYGGEGGSPQGTPASGGGVLDVGGEPANAVTTTATVGSFGSGTYNSSGTWLVHGSPSAEGGGLSGGHIGDVPGAGDGGSSSEGGAAGGGGASITVANATTNAGDGGSSKGRYGGGALNSAYGEGKQDATVPRTGGGGGVSGNANASLEGGRAVFGNGIYVVFSSYCGVSSASITGPWVPFKAPFRNPGDAIWDGAKWVVLAGSMVYTSSDLASWEVHVLPGYAYGIAYGAGLYAIAMANGAIYTSPNLTTWTQRTTGVSTAIAAIKWSGSYFIAVGNFGVTLKSTDGITWALVTAVSTSHGLSDVEVSGSTIVATSDTTPFAVYSTNSGASWSVVTTTLSAYGRVTKGTSYWIITSGSNVYSTGGPSGSWQTDTDGQTGSYSDCVANGDNYVCSLDSVARYVGISATSPTSTWTAMTYTAAFKAGDRGGAGAAPGGGGGGGGASENGFDSGEGGPGADGYARIFTL